MVVVTDQTGDLAPGGTAEAAMDLINSGKVNFGILNRKGEDVLATAVVELNRNATAQGHVDQNLVDGNGFVHLPYNANTGLNAVFVNESFRLSRPGQSGNTVSNVTSTIIHETLHLTGEVFQARAATNTNLENNPDYLSAKSNLTAVQERQLNILLEEKVIRDTVDLIDSKSAGFDRTGIRGYTDAERLVAQYAKDLPQSLKDLLIAELDAEVVLPVVVVDGVPWGKALDGSIVEVDPITGQPMQDAEPGVGFLATFAAAGQQILEDVSNAASAIGGAIRDGINAIGNAVVSAANAVGEFFSDTVSYFTGGNDDDEGTSSDDDNGKPVILDLDGDGIEINVRGDVSFDMDNDGFLESTAWADVDDGFLVLDLAADGTRGAGDGVIDQTDELILSNWVDWEGATDLQALATFDQWAERGGNNDGKLSAADDVWDELKVWQDFNQNGVTDAGELVTLDSLGITEIALDYDDGTEFGDLSNDISVMGSHLLGSATFKHDGSQLGFGDLENGQYVVAGGVGDVSLSFKDAGYRTVTENGLTYFEYELGGQTIIAQMDGSGSQNVDLYALNLDGVYGDDRANVLDARGRATSVAVAGFEGNDRLFGSDVDDVLSGGIGADSLYGGYGNDTFYIDGDDVTVYGSDGSDTVIVETADAVNFNLTSADVEAGYGNAGHDLLTAEGSYDDIELNGGAGNDELRGGYADDNLTGGEGDDLLRGDDADDALIGGIGDDTLYGGSGDDLNFGGDGNDTVHAGSSSDTAYGGSGADTLYGDSSDDELYGGDANDTLYGGVGDDVLSGGDGNDLIVDVLGDHQAFGGDGDDQFDLSGNGYHVVRGGLGQDTLHIEGALSDWTYVASDNGQYSFRSSDSMTYFDIIDVEKVVFASGEQLDLAGVSSDTDNGDLLTAQNDGSDRLFGTVHNSIWSSGALASSTTETQSYGQDINGLQDPRIDDTFYGNGGNDSIQAMAGEDTLYGGSGEDIVRSGAGEDLIYGNGGADLLFGDDGADDIYGGDGDDQMAGGAGNDSIVGGSGQDVILGGIGNDHAFGGSGADQLAGDEGNDTLYGESGSDDLFGGAGNDFINAGVGADEVSGGDGQDTIFGSSGHDVLLGDAGSDTLNGGAGSDILFGGAGNDLLQGSTDNDNIDGGAGNDTLEGGTGQDVLNGGAGADVIDGQEGLQDVVSYATSDAAVNVSLRDYSALGGHAIGDTLLNVEGINGSEFNDVLTGNDADNQLIGDAGNDQLSGDGGRDLLAGGDGNDTIYGGSGDDTAIGGAGDDFIHTTTGNDQLFGGEGTDTMTGGAGDDSYFIDDGLDFVIETSNGGIDRIVSSVAIDLTGRNGAYANVENLTVTGSENLVAYGTADDNILIGNEGDNSIGGRAGDDVLEGGSGADVLMGGTGEDTVSHASANAAVLVDLNNHAANEHATLYLQSEARGDTYSDIEHATGSGFNDNIRGDGGANKLMGLSGNDYLFGRGGNDTIDGGRGADKMFGASGDDTYYVDTLADEITEGATQGQDRIITTVSVDLTGMNGAFANVENVSLAGSADLAVHATSAANALTGNSGDNWLNGRAGNDMLNGLGGDDKLSGGSGADTFFFNASVASGADEITDFARGTDHIRMSGAAFGDLTISYSSGDANVVWSNGSVLVENTSLLTADDFQFI